MSLKLVVFYPGCTYESTEACKKKFKGLYPTLALIRSIGQDMGI
jgi:hypothetical protein